MFARHLDQQETAISEDNGQEQNVPQQIDLTEEDDDEDDNNQEIEEENVEEQKIDGVKEDHDESEGRSADTESYNLHTIKHKPK